MVHPLYWTTALVFSVVLGLMLIHDCRADRSPKGIEGAFRQMLIWVLYFCIQDTVWGICASIDFGSDVPLTIASTLFHMSTVTTTYFWLSYILTYLGDRIRHRRLFLLLDAAVIAVQLVMVTANLFTPVIFYIENGIYHTAFLRPFAFANQYIVYVLIGVATLVQARRVEGEMHRRYIAVFTFALAPILTGVFQLLFPDAPFYSIGYFLGCVIVHLFIVQGEREALVRLQHEVENQVNERRIAEQIHLSSTDALTGLPNRRAYEGELQADRIGANMTYISIDVNGLKEANDSLGHAAGDELLIGAARCLDQCLGAYGTVFRTGGDEFVAMIACTQTELRHIREDLQTTVDAWQGEAVKVLSISIGVAERREFPVLTMTQLAKVADDRMYKAKAAYYLNKGVDRRGQQTAYAALCSSYEKILRVNLTDDSYRVIFMDEAERTKAAGFSSRLSAWLHDFGVSGYVHETDRSTYLAQTDLAFLRRKFAEGSKYHSVFYHRRLGNGFRAAMLELIPAEDYAPDCQCLYLYVKDIDRR